MKKLICIIGIILILAPSIIAQEKDFPKLTGPYLGQKPPFDKPEPFLHDFFCKEYELHAPPVFSKDGLEVYWTPMTGLADHIHFMKQHDGVWSKPAIFPFIKGLLDADNSHLSVDGSRLYLTTHILTSDGPKELIMYIDREGEKWNEPKSVGDNVNSLDIHWQISVNKNYDLYFHVRNDDMTDGNIFYSKYINGTYQTPEKLGSKINTGEWENFPFIAPDNSYLIFSRKSTETGDDLYITFKDENGNWGDTMKMDAINSPYNDMYPVVTPDSKYLFFLSERCGGARPYWVSAKIIEELKPKKLK